MRVLTGGISEGLMVLASRQYVRAQEGELAAIFRDTAWNLHQQLWQWTVEANPELEAAERRRLLDRLTTPLRDIDTPPSVKAVLSGRLYQVLVIAHLRDNDLSSHPRDSQWVHRQRNSTTTLEPPQPGPLRPGRRRPPRHLPRPRQRAATPPEKRRRSTSRRRSTPRRTTGNPA